MKLLLERWNKYLNEDLNTATRLSVFDFDETLAFSEGKINILDQTGNIVDTISIKDHDKWEDDERIKSGELKFEFSDLDVITNPTEIIAITDIMRDRTADGSTQVMVVTARTSRTSDDIHRYLDAINVPTDDLTSKEWETKDSEEARVDLFSVFSKSSQTSGKLSSMMTHQKTLLM